MPTPGLELTSPTAALAEQFLTWRHLPEVTRWFLQLREDPEDMRREQHGVKDSFHAELGWVDGYTYAILAEEWNR